MGIGRIETLGGVGVTSGGFRQIYLPSNLLVLWSPLFCSPLIDHVYDGIYIWKGLKALIVMKTSDSFYLESAWKVIER